MRKISEYEAHAAECRKLAGQMKDPGQKLQLEEMANAWDMMARVREKQLLKRVSRDGATAPATMPDDGDGP